MLFRFDPDGTYHRIINGATIPNGMSWSKDDKTFYFAETQDACIYAYDYDSEKGEISNKRLFFRVEEEGSAPDGHTQDEYGNLWIAVWGAWKVVRVSPEGKITAEVHVPTRCPTVYPRTL